MPENFRRVDAPDVLTTFAGFTEMLDRMHEEPLRLTPSRPHPPLRGQIWLDSEEDLLIKLYRQGWSYRKIAIEVGRSANAVSQRLYVLGYGRQ